MDTLDVRGVPDKHVEWLRRLVEDLRTLPHKQERKHVRKIEFATYDSDVVGGEFKRANAYE